MTENLEGSGAEARGTGNDTDVPMRVLRALKNNGVIIKVLRVCNEER